MKFFPLLVSQLLSVTTVSALSSAVAITPKTLPLENNFLVRGNRHQETDVLLRLDSIHDYKDSLLHIDALANRKLQSITPIYQGKLVPTDGAKGDHFGVSVAIYGDKAIVAAYGDDDEGSESGSAYIYGYDGTTWVEEAKLVPTDAANVGRGAQFGWSVAIHGNKVIVGAPWDEDNGITGSAYIYAHDGVNWVQEAKLLPTDGNKHDDFGASVAIYGNKVIVGARYGDDWSKAPLISNSGSAYIYAHDGTDWVQEAKLVATDRGSGHHFGWSVAIHGDNAIVGAPNTFDKGQHSGTAYIFAHNGTTWVQEAKLLAPDGAQYDYFGWSVSIYGNKVIAGAHFNNAASTNSGSAYIYVHDGTTWVQEAKIVPADGAWDDLFGGSVAMYGDKVIIGCGADDDKGSASGSAYIFTHNGTNWVQEAKLLAADGGVDDWFGYSVAIHGDNVIVGAHNVHYPQFANDAGSAYIWGGLGPVTGNPTGSPSKSPVMIGPPSIPPTSSPVSTDWTIIYKDDLRVDFSVNSTHELEFSYDITVHRSYNYSLFQSNCITPITDVNVSITDLGGRYSKDESYDTLVLACDVDKAKIAGSSIWNATTNQMELCVVVHLLMEDLNMVMKQDERVLTIDFDLLAGFNFTNGLEEGDLQEGAGSTDVDDYVQACKCGGPDSFTCDSSPQLPNDKLHVCVWSLGTDVELSAVESMVLTQGDVYSLDVIVANEIKIPQITSWEYLQAENGFVVSTLLPSNMFLFDTNEAPLTISGSVELELAGSRRKLQVDNLFDAPKVEEKGRYEVQVSLTSDEVGANGIIMRSNAAASITVSMVGYYAAVVGLALVLACIV